VAKQFGLGRGLGALIPDTVAPEGEAPKASATAAVGKLRPNPDQPRKEFRQEALEELADSIRGHGVLQPILVEEDGAGGYVIVAGERRWRAAQMAGLREVPIIVRNFSDPERLEIAIIENIQREDLNPLEEAQAYKSLMGLSGLPQEEIAKRVGKNRSTVANALRLLKLPEECLAGLKDGSLTAGHARAILAVANPADQIVLMKRIRDGGLSVRQAEENSKALNAGQRASSSATIKKAGQAPKKPRVVELADIEQKLIGFLGTKVSLSGSASKGKIVIEYYSQEDLERILEAMSGD
jgi:ParB family transcriptional regulator, chromosome partitioning protein